ncbi:hypothetical protein LguiA_005992 [Lonicera macranthoides]
MGNLSSFFIILLLLISLSSQSAAKLRSSKLTPRLSGKKFSHLDKPSKILNLQQYKYETQYFDQRLDHFSFAEFPNFRRKHLISFDHWNVVNVPVLRSIEVFFFSEWNSVNSMDEAQVCKKIDSGLDGTSVLEHIFKGISVYYNYTGSVDCFDLDDEFNFPTGIHNKTGPTL